MGKRNPNPSDVEFESPRLRPAVKHERRSCILVRDDFDLAPAYEPRLVGSGECLERRFLRRQSRGKVHGRPDPRLRIRHFISREQSFQHAIAFPVEHFFDAGDFDKVNANAANHEPFRTTNNFSRTVWPPLRAMTIYTPFANRAALRSQAIVPPVATAERHTKRPLKS